MNLNDRLTYALAHPLNDTAQDIAPARAGHLRVAVTAAEHDTIPPGCATTDAGPAGPARKRTRR